MLSWSSPEHLNLLELSSEHIKAHIILSLCDAPTFWSPLLVISSLCFICGIVSFKIMPGSWVIKYFNCINSFHMSEFYLSILSTSPYIKIPLKYFPEISLAFLCINPDHLESFPEVGPEKIFRLCIVLSHHQISNYFCYVFKLLMLCW